MDYYILTGASRGIGEAIARKLLVHGNTIFCVSRNLNEDLIETASSLDVPMFYFESDLSDPEATRRFMSEVFSHIEPEKVMQIALINNAGMLEPIAPIDQADALVIENHLKVNLLAPALLISAFIAETEQMNVPKVILNISSGAAQFPYAGWSMYCASKAGLDMLTRTVGLEQSVRKSPVKIFSLAPGIVDTSMQTLIRQSDEELFAEKDFFVKLHQEGKLSNPGSVAGIIASALFNERIPQGGVLTIDQLKEFKSN